VKGQVHRLQVRERMGKDTDLHEWLRSRRSRSWDKLLRRRASRRLGAAIAREELDTRGQEAALKAICERLGFPAEAA
jgi:hypothetical protein